MYQPFCVQSPLPGRFMSHDCSILIVSREQTSRQYTFIIFKNCLSRGFFPTKMEKRKTLFQFSKKMKETSFRIIDPSGYYLFVSNYLNNLYPYIFNNNFIDDRQSGYRTGDSTSKQLISITRNLQSF